jgi:ribosome-associated heat shock protein Hsp15
MPVQILVQEMTENKPVRIDKYLWAIRIFKTRSLATNACRMSRVMVNGSPVKPSKTIEGNEIITVKKPPVNYSYKVIFPIENRVSAKLVVNYAEDLTSENEKMKTGFQGLGFTGLRKKGTGHPTKKERRIIDKWQDNCTSS